MDLSLTIPRFNEWAKNLFLTSEQTYIRKFKEIITAYRIERQYSKEDILVHSINVPAVALLDEMGVDIGIDFMKRSGIPLHEDDQNLSIALGGFTEGVSPLEMSQAFSIFPNLGSMNIAHTITKITSSTGKILFEIDEEKSNHQSP